MSAHRALPFLCINVPVSGSYICNPIVGIAGGNLRMGEKPEEIFPEVVLSRESAYKAQRLSEKDIG